MKTSYTTLPTASQFKKDSSVKLAIRSHDRILQHIDWLLEAYDKYSALGDYSKRRVVLTDLFLTCNYWIKCYHQGNSRMKKERYPTVHALFEAVVAQLGVLLGCGRVQVSRMIDEIYGRELHEYGIRVDDQQGRAKYLSNLERQVYRLRFKGGLAYQYPWWLPKSNPNLVLVESSRAYTKIVRKGADNNKAEGSENYGGFAMTMDRVIYMAKHIVRPDAGKHDGIFHSSYTFGERVTMAGTMLIKKGVILAIRSDSGHYQPTQMNMAACVQALGMLGVSLKKIQLFDFKGDPAGNALDLLKSHLSWDKFLLQREDERANRINSDNIRLGRGVQARHPHLQPRATVPDNVGAGGAEYNG